MSALSKSRRRTQAVNSGPLGPGLMTTREVAEFLGVSMWQLEYWRSRKPGGPAFIKIGRLVRYRPRDVIEFVRSGRKISGKFHREKIASV